MTWFMRDDFSAKGGVSAAAMVRTARGVVGEVDHAAAVAAGILGGGQPAGTHAAKAGTRVLINASPEPFSNWTASVVEDVAVIGGLWTAVRYPLLFTVLVLWLLSRLLKGIKKVWAYIGRLFSREPAGGKVIHDLPPAAGTSSGSMEMKLAQLRRRFQDGLITESEYTRKKTDLL